MNPREPDLDVLRVLRGVVVCAVAAHALARLALVLRGDYFATEDDGYRAYYGHLFVDGSGAVVGRFWLPGQFFVLGLLGRLGFDAAVAPLVLGGLSLVAVALASASMARDAAPTGWGPSAALGAVAVAAFSPLELRLAHSSLAEPLGNALLAMGAAGVLRWRANLGTGPLVAGALATLAATWVRYEAWPYAFFFALAVLAIGRERALRSPVVLLGGVPLLGPLGWMAAQLVVYGDPLAFLETIEGMSDELAGPASSWGVAGARLAALATWALGASGFAALALALPGPRARVLAVWAAFGLPGLVLQIASGSGLGVFVIRGVEYDFFSPRLVSNIEVGLLPLAGLGVAKALASTGQFARWSTAVGLLALGVIGLVAAGATPMTLVDPSSRDAGLALRRGGLDPGPGALLVERVEPRPPMGWASLSVLWSHWDRTVFVTRRGRECVLVEASEVARGRETIPCASLGAWAEHRGVTSAWLVSAAATELAQALWPEATVQRVGRGSFVVLPGASTP